VIEVYESICDLKRPLSSEKNNTFLLWSLIREVTNRNMFQTVTVADFTSAGRIGTEDRINWRVGDEQKRREEKQEKEDGHGASIVYIKSLAHWSQEEEGVKRGEYRLLPYTLDGKWIYTGRNGANAVWLEVKAVRSFDKRVGWYSYNCVIPHALTRALYRALYWWSWLIIRCCYTNV